jgi:tetratricopeptide (TPR) repeat protein
LTRPRRNLLLYAAALLGFGWLGVVLPYWAGWVMTGGLLLVLLLIGWVGRELFRGRMLMQQRRYVEAAQALQRFQTQQQASAPARGVAVLFAGRYTANAVAVAENDLGAIASENGHPDVARRHFEQAVALDPGYAIPHVNLALLLASRHDEAGARAEAEKARDLGFRSKGLQRAVDAALARPS